jgi:hypothetical protein
LLEAILLLLTTVGISIVLGRYLEQCQFRAAV